MLDLSIVIQGPLNPTNLRISVDTYQAYGPVIVSCYDTDLGKIECDEFPNVTFLFNPTPKQVCANYANLHLHSYTTAAGLAVCKTPWVIKTRSDEYFLDLNKVIEKMRKGPNKWVTHPVWFKKVEKEWLHPGDHLIGGCTICLLHAFKTTMELCRSYGDPQKQFNIYELGFNQPFAYQYQSGLLFPENVFFLNYLKALFGPETQQVLLEHNSLEGFRKLMQTYADVVPFEDLGDFCCTYLNANNQRVFHTKPNDIYNDNVVCDSPIIKDMSEV